MAQSGDRLQDVNDECEYEDDEKAADETEGAQFLPPDCPFN